MKTYNVLSCPSCGDLPKIQYWHGGSRKKRMVLCENAGCAMSPSVTGSDADRAVAKWNERSLPASVGSVAVTPR